MMGRIKNNVARLNVTMDNLLLAEVFQGENNLSREVLCQDVIKTAVLTFEKVLQTASRAVLHEQI